MKPWFGYHIPWFTFPDVPREKVFDRVAYLAGSVEKAGFSLVTVMDHFYQIQGVGPETDPMLEASTTLGALAARTKRVRLATLVTGVTYRNPAMLAKMVTTLDVISGGRAVLGRHCAAFGRDPSTIERTMATPVIVAANEAAGKAVVERLPPERRAHVKVGTPEQAAEVLRPYLDAGFTGFTFNNPVLPNAEAIGAAGELLKLIS